MGYTTPDMADLIGPWHFHIWYKFNTGLGLNTQRKVNVCIQLCVIFATVYNDENSQKCNICNTQNTMTDDSVHGRGCERQMYRGRECWLIRMLLFKYLYMYAYVRCNFSWYLFLCWPINMWLLALSYCYIHSTNATFIEESNKNVNTRSLNLFHKCVKFIHSRHINK